jgi:hypothetical protein
LKKQHSDIMGDIHDLYSNTLAGAYYLRDQLQRHANDPRGGVIGYHGPTTPAQQADAEKQANKVTTGYSGSPLLPNNLADVNAQLAAARSAAGQTPAPEVTSGEGRTDRNQAAAGSTNVHATEQQTIATNRLNETLEIETAQLRDRNLRGQTPENIAQDETRINADVLKRQREYPDYQAGQNPRTDQDLADYRAQLEKVANDRRQRQQDEIDQKAQAQQQKLVDALSSLRESIDKQDKTNPVAARAAVDEQRKRGQAAIDNARAAGVTTVGTTSIDDFQKQYDAAYADKADNAGSEADQAAVDKVLASRKAAYDKLQSDLKAGLITIVQAFQQANDIAAKFNPKIREAAQAAQADLSRQNQGSPQVQAAESHIAQQTAPSRDDTAQLAVVNTGITQAENLAKSRTSVEQQQKALVQAGVQTSDQAEAAIRAAFAATADESKQLIASIQAQLDTLKQLGEIAPATYDELTNKLKLMQTQTTYVSDAQKELVKTIENDLTGDAMKAFDQIGTGVSKLITTHENFKAVIYDVAKAFDDFAADFLKQIAEMIIKQQLLAALQSTGILGAGGGTGGATGWLGSLLGGGASASTGSFLSSLGSSDLSSATNAALGSMGSTFGPATAGAVASAAGGAAGGSSIFSGIMPAIMSLFAHGGQMIGAPAMMTRAIDPTVFINAPRYHDGGMVGLSADEVPAILQQGEQVLSKSQVRANMTTGSQAQGQSIRNVLAIGDKELASAMAGSDGEKVVLNHLKRNVPTLRNWIGSS